MCANCRQLAIAKFYQVFQLDPDDEVSTRRKRQQSSASIDVGLFLAARLNNL